MESTHRAPNQNVSIRKMRMLLPAAMRLSPVVALQRLSVMPHSAAKVLFDVVETALANASSALKVPKDMLEFKKLYADQGIVMKRYRAGSRGSPRPVLRRLTHVTVVLGEKSAPNVQQQLPKIEKEEAKSAAVKKTVRKTKSTKQSEVAKS